MTNNQKPFDGSAFSTAGDFLALTKPRVMSLLVLSAIAGAFLGAASTPSIRVLIAVLIGGALASGGAAALNMAYEGELDQLMGRTKNRPVAEGRITARSAILFGVLLNATAAVVFSLMANVLAAALAIAGTVIYFGLYTVVLKRTTTQNIVIGGGAGAIPPLVGYAAATGTLDLSAWYLFAIVFFWTPPHFWALAIMIKDDYAKAGIPMLPVVRGIGHTCKQIFFYTVILFVLTLMLGIVGDPLGWKYMTGAMMLSAGFMWYAFRLLRYTERPSAAKLYKFSLLYLGLFFILVMVDSIAV